MNRKTKFAALGLTLVLSSMMLVATIATVSASGSGWESHYGVYASQTLDMQPGNLWSNLNNIYSTQGGGNYASVAGNGENDIQYSYVAKIRFHGFSIPTDPGWVITGYVFKLGGYMVNSWDQTSSVRDYSVQLVYIHALTVIKGSNTPQGTWPTSYTIRSYGSSSDTWGVNLLPWMINNNGLWIYYEAKFIDGAYVPALLRANGAQLTIYYYQP